MKIKNNRETDGNTREYKMREQTGEEESKQWREQRPA